MFLLLENLDRKKSFGIGKVHPFLLSVGALEITKPLTHLINLSLTQGKFPDSRKIAIRLFQSLNRVLTCFVLIIVQSQCSLH